MTPIRFGVWMVHWHPHTKHVYRLLFEISNMGHGVFITRIELPFIVQLEVGWALPRGWFGF